MKNHRLSRFLQMAVATLAITPVLSVTPAAYAAQSSSAPVITKAAFLYNLFAGSQLGATGVSPYADAPTGSWEWKVVNAALKLGLIAPDSSTHFGASDPVTLGQAANAINQLLNLSLPPSVTALSWLQQKGVLPRGTPLSDLTLAADLQTMSILSGKAVQSLDYVPASWKVSATQAENLIRSMRVLYYLELAQEQSTDTVSLTYALTPTALKIPQAVAEVKKLDQNERSVTQVGVAPSSLGQTRLIASQTYLNGQKVQSVEIFTQGNKQYADVGNGWQPIHQQVSTNAAVGMQFQSTALEDVTAVQQGGEWNYQAKINLSEPTVAAELVQLYATDTNMDLTQAQELKLKTLFEQDAVATASYQLHLAQDGTPQLTMLKQNFTVDIPSTEFPLANEADRAQFDQAVKYVTFSFGLVQHIQFNHTPIPIPPGLSQSAAE